MVVRKEEAARRKKLGIPPPSTEQIEAFKKRKKL
jgi:hypothetical protein